MIVLIADDEPNIRLLVRDMLGKDHIVLEASDGEEAVNMAHSRKPDLIMMDIIMPKVGGYAACSRIKSDQVTKEIPVVMLTGLDQEVNKKLAKTIGADGYITKPFSLQDLQHTIGRFVKSQK